MGRVATATALHSRDYQPIEGLRRPPHPLQVHRGSSAPLLFMQAGSAKRLKRAGIKSAAFMSMLSLPEGTWSGASGLPAPHLMRAERGSFPASRSALSEIFELLSGRDSKNLAHTKTALFGKSAYDREASPIESLLPRRSKRQRLSDIDTSPLNSCRPPLSTDCTTLLHPLLATGGFTQRCGYIR